MSPFRQPGTSIYDCDVVNVTTYLCVSKMKMHNSNKISTIIRALLYYEAVEHFHSFTLNVLNINILCAYYYLWGIISRYRGIISRHFIDGFLLSLLIHSFISTYWFLHILEDQVWCVPVPHRPDPSVAGSTYVLCLNYTVLYSNLHPNTIYFRSHRNYMID